MLSNLINRTPIWGNKWKKNQKTTESARNCSFLSPNLRSNPAESSKDPGNPPKKWWILPLGAAKTKLAPNNCTLRPGCTLVSLWRYESPKKPSEGSPNMAGKWTELQDVFPIENVDFPACHVSLLYSRAKDLWASRAISPSQNRRRDPKTVSVPEIHIRKDSNSQ